MFCRKLPKPLLDKRLLSQHDGETPRFDLYMSDSTPGTETRKEEKRTTETPLPPPPVVVVVPPPVLAVGNAGADAGLPRDTAVENLKEGMLMHNTRCR